MTRLCATAKSHVLNAVLVVELVTAFEHADPGFLKQVFRQFAASGQVQEIAKKAMLVLLDQTVEQVGISTSKSTSDLRALLRHRVLEIEGSRVHTTDTYEAEGEKTQGIGKTVRELDLSCLN